jgi:DNA-binding transcriptional MerR regulator
MKKKKVTRSSGKPARAKAAAATPSTAHRTSAAQPRSVTISEVARRVGISASMIRAWERMGMVRPFRAESSYRFYSENDIAILHRAVYLRKYRGLNAPAILEQLGEEGYLTNTPTKKDRDSIGPRLRRLRMRRKESLQTVASSVGVSVGFLSNLERSQTTASVSTMQRLAYHYGLDSILAFFDRADNTHPQASVAEGIDMELLAWGPIFMQPYLFRLAPGATSGGSYAHAGQEFVYVIGGMLTLTVDDTNYEMSAGESLFFESNRPHSFLNPGKKETKVLWINSPETQP